MGYTDNMSESKSKIVYFVRHGQSVDNASPVFQSIDSPLSRKGEIQAGQIANRIKQLEFDSLIASPIKRAKQTAEAISKITGRDIEFNELLRERDKPDSIDGRPWEDPVAQKVWREWEASLYQPALRIENGENYADLVSRSDTTLEYLLQHPSQKLVVVTHGYFLRALLARALFEQNLTSIIAENFIKKLSIENTAITVLKYQDAFEEDYAWRIWTLNDQAHFAE